MTTQEYWKKIRAIAADFDPESLARDKEEEEPTERVHLKRSQKPCWITSRENPEKGSIAGATVEARPYLAAECIFAQTHLRATDQEIAAEIARRDRERVRIEDEERIRKSDHSKETGQSIAQALREGQEGLGASIGASIAEAILSGQQAAQQKPSRRGE